MYPNLKLQIFRRAVRQNYLARELGIDESSLSKIIHGYREPSQEQRRSLALYLQVEEGWLFEKYEVSPPDHGSDNRSGENRDERT